jgi:hypothetical protein
LTGDGEVVDILRRVEARRDLDRDRARGRLDVARRDQLVVVDDRVDQVLRRDVVGLEREGVEDDLEHLVPRAGETGLEHRRQPFQRVLHLVGEPDQRAFGRVARERHDDDREFREVDFAIDQLSAPAGKLRLGAAHGVAHIGDGGGLVPAELELEEEAGIAFGGGRGDRGQPVEVLELRFHRPHEQAFAVLRRDAGEGDRDEEAGDVDVGLALLRQADIGGRTDGQRQDHEGDDHSRPAGGPVDQAGHCVSSS